MNEPLNIEVAIRQSKPTTAFQPIVSLEKKGLIGYEALARTPDDSPWQGPRGFLEAAILSGQLVEVEMLCRQRAIAAFAEQKLPGFLFLNVSPAVCTHGDLYLKLTLELLRAQGLEPQQVVLEVSQIWPIYDYKALLKAMAKHREAGFALAIDDLGSSNSSLRLWAELRPEWLKIDRILISHVHKDQAKAALVRSLVDVGPAMGSNVVAMGVEKKEEYETLWRLGVRWAQGYYFAHPMMIPPREIDPSLFLGTEEVKVNSRTECVSAVVEKNIPTVEPKARLADVAELFYTSPRLKIVAVVDQNKHPLGLVRRDDFMNIWASRYGRDLYGKKPIADNANQFMDKNPYLVESTETVEKLAQTLTLQTGASQEHEDFIVVDRGKFVGVGTLRSLLRTITELQVRNARHANPLTGLPGNVPINEEINRRLAAQENFAICYFDLDNFKPFNDHYGFAKGDEVIRLVAKCIGDHINPEKDFVGHVGGDDFVVIFGIADWQDRVKAVLADFDKEALRFYTPEEQKNGIVSQDRQGNLVRFPVVSISAGAIAPEPGLFTTCQEISDILAECKHQAKKIQGSSLFVDRRYTAHTWD